LFYNTNTKKGMGFKAAACPITGICRHMEIQRAKKGMKTATFNAAVGATAGCTLWLLLDSIPEDARGKRQGICGDAWFGSVWAASEISRCGHEIVFSNKTKCEIPLIAICYHYSRKTMLFFYLPRALEVQSMASPMK
jgi:hypothetical protein